MGAAFGHAPVDTEGRVPAALQTLYNQGNRVEVVATPFGPGIPGVRAYHTSIHVEDVEFSFSPVGISQGRLAQSHTMMREKTQVMYMGLTCISGQEMLKALTPHFKRGTYDLLRKNCNSFSDCALFHLLDIRLDPVYRGLEQIGHVADKHVGVVQALSEGQYAPNPLADAFDVEVVVKQINKEKNAAMGEFT
mmetsp:Transcript_72610/g.212981  ORF Transcript_72610/g.212981 Transcript_72610/m.212981 type:complete len:192 (+) Transcript_72610:53-628(+)